MRPNVAKKTTRCELCGDDIIPGSQRLDDYTRKRGKLIRLYYHRTCYERYLATFYSKTADLDTIIRNNGGRKPLDLTPSQHMERNRILRNLSAVRSYYKDKLPITPIQDWTPTQFKRLKNFQSRYLQLTEELEAVGGLPPNYTTPKPQLPRNEEVRDVIPVDNSVGEGVL